MLVNSTQQLQTQVNMVEILHHISEHKGQYCHKLVTLIVQLLLLLLHPTYKHYNTYIYNIRRKKYNNKFICNSTVDCRDGTSVFNKI